MTLVASAATGATFTGWSGACGGTATTCTVLMNQSKSVTATFRRPGGGDRLHAQRLGQWQRHGHRERDQLWERRDHVHELGAAGRDHRHAHGHTCQRCDVRRVGWRLRRVGDVADVHRHDHGVGQRLGDLHRRDEQRPADRLRDRPRHRDRRRDRLRQRLGGMQRTGRPGLDCHADGKARDRREVRRLGRLVRRHRHHVLADDDERTERLGHLHDRRHARHADDQRRRQGDGLHDRGRVHGHRPEQDLHPALQGRRLGDARGQAVRRGSRSSAGAAPAPERRRRARSS